MAKIDIGDMIVIAVWDGSSKKERRGIVINKHKTFWKHQLNKEWSYTVEWLDSNERTNIYESEQGTGWFKCSLAARKNKAR